MRISVGNHAEQGKPSATVPRKQQSGFGPVRTVRFNVKRVAGRRPPTSFNKKSLRCEV